MFKKSFVISLLFIGMMAILVNDARGLDCRRCRSLPGICLETLWEKIKVTFKTQTTTGFTLEGKSISFTSWCNPSGACQQPSGDLGPFFFPADIDVEEFSIVNENDLVKGRYVIDKTKFYDCELRDLWGCATQPVLMDYTQDDGTIEPVYVCTSYIDYTKIPATSPPYWDEGQIGKWTPEDPFCPAPWILSNPDAQGGFLVGLLWVQTYKVVTTCFKDVCTDETTLGDAACFELDTTTGDPETWDYNQVDNIKCGM